MKKTSKKIWIIVSVLILVVLIAGIFANIIIKDYYSQEKAIERMFSLRADMKLEEYYNCFDIPEKSQCYMNSLEAYLLMAKEKNWSKIDSFKITQKRIDTYSVKYGEHEETLELIKQEKNGPFGSDVYKIKIESVTSPVLFVSTHINADFTVDGKSNDYNKLNIDDIQHAYDLFYEEDISNLYKNRNIPINYYQYFDETYDNYCFANVFDREYKIVIKTDYTEPLEKTITPSEEPYIIRELLLSDETENQLKQLGESFVQKFYYSLQNKEDFDSISNLVTSNEEKREVIKENYEEKFFVFSRDKESTGIVDICFLNSTSNIIYPGEFDVDQSKYTVSTTLDYSYNSISYDGFLDEYEYNNDMFDSTLFRIDCVKENGVWVVSEIPDISLNAIY